MKKFVIAAIFLVFGSLSAFAEGLYFDVGLGLGKGWTKIGGVDMSKDLKAHSTGSVSQTTIDLGLKLGYGPFGDIPLYIVGELGGIGHRFSVGSEHLQFNSYIFGPGVIYYPMPLIQLGASLGYSWIANQTNASDPNTKSLKDLKSKSGYAYNLYGAIDLGESNHGCLIGLKYFYAKNKLKYEGTSLGIDQKQSMISVFARYAFRHKDND